MVTALIHDSLAEIPEDKLVDRVVTDVLWGREFFQFYGTPSGMVNRQCVPLNSAPGNPKGDIDVLLCAPDHPEQSVAYQVKRLKFGISQLRNGVPSKLEEFKKLAQQTNLIARMGFWQVYAAVIVVADAREQNAEAQNTGKLTFQGLSSGLRILVNSAVSSAIRLFDTRIGIEVIEFIQTMDSEPFTVGTSGLHILRRSQPGTQSEQLSQWIANVFSTPAREHDKETSAYPYGRSL
jgi:hypothetical protein